MTDLLIGLVVMPLSLDHLLHSGHLWRLGDRACLPWLLTDTMACTASVWNLVAIAVDRVVVRQPF